MSDLPAHVKAALDAAAEGRGRVPTAAHPDCICHKRIGTAVSDSYKDEHGNPWVRPIIGKPKDCPQHRKEKP